MANITKRHIIKPIAKEANPLVSVIMPVFNAEKYVGEAIESILKQTFQDFELIVVDDASTDASPSIIRAYQKKYPHKIRILTMKKNVNCGGDACANEGIKIARGEYIARMDADDISHPTRFEKQVCALKHDHDLFLIGTNAYVIDSEGYILGDKHEPISKHEIYTSYFTFHPIIHPSVMFRKYIEIEGKKQLFQYKTKYSANNDYYTFFSLICQGKKITNLKEKLLSYRMHGKNDTFVNVKKKFMNTLNIRIEMVRYFGYKPSSLQIATTLLQAIILLTLPERLTIQLYLLAKGIVSFRELLPEFNPFHILKSVKTRFSLLQ